MFRSRSLNSSGDQAQLDSNAVWKAALLLVCVALVLFGTVVAVVVAANELKSEETLRPEIVLPLIVIVGVVALLVTLSVSAAMFRIFTISDREQALGLPAGSVQAVIALGLILIFAVVALYSSSASGKKEFTSTGVTETQLNTIPPTELAESHPEEGTSPVTYEVRRSVEDQDLKDINLQLLTTVSTLMVAVAAFYFGSKSVQEAGKIVTDASGPKRSLSIASPSSPYEWKAGLGQLNIRVNSEPANALLRWSIQNDPDGQLQNLEDGSFDYTPGQRYKKGGTAILQFEQADDPTVTAPLIVNFEGSDESEQPAEPVETPTPDPTVTSPPASPPPIARPS